MSQHDKGGGPKLNWADCQIRDEQGQNSIPNTEAKRKADPKPMAIPNSFVSGDCIR